MTRTRRKRYKSELVDDLTQKLHAADLRTQILETALRQIAEQPSDDPAALQQIAIIALQKADETQPTGLR
jgi:hypothetical protein